MIDAAEVVAVAVVVVPVIDVRIELEGIPV